MAKKTEVKKLPIAANTDVEKEAIEAILSKDSEALGFGSTHAGNAGDLETDEEVTGTITAFQIGGSFPGPDGTLQKPRVYGMVVDEDDLDYRFAVPLKKWNKLKKGQTVVLRKMENNGIGFMRLIEIVNEESGKTTEELAKEKPEVN